MNSENSFNMNEEDNALLEKKYDRIYCGKLKKLLVQYETMLNQAVIVLENTKREKAAAIRLVEISELALLEIQRRYELCKGVIQTHEESENYYQEVITIIRNRLVFQIQENTILKENAMAVLQKANKEIFTIKQLFNSEISHLKSQIKNYEITNNHLKKALTEKTKECEELYAVYNEFIEKV